MKITKYKLYLGNLFRKDFNLCYTYNSNETT